ncbi:unnamed protein product [Arctia plantaginis]|uniref:Uncharacterized protein n=1 Tax=Arctia plantaginis TaxID=874455 RepID=A0A8S0Z0R1_ARCPL|nr:unnamed protein product [Arctia plantaginis]
MTINWMLLILLQYDITVISSPSIAGVTYMDNFDFEERYKDVNECNPFYWHPLHLPEVCADMFEQLIRSKLAKNNPVRVMRERDPYDVYSLNPMQMDFSHPMYEIGTDGDASTTYGKRKPLTPYEKMLELLKKDIKKQPSVPKIGMLPHLGPVAIYNQEISKKSETMIKELATSYAKIGQQTYADYLGYNDSPDPQLYIWDSEKNRTEEYKAKQKKKKNKDKISRTKTKQGGVVTIVETRNPRRRRRSILLTILSLDGVLCTIDGSLNFQRPRNATKPGEDPCNPLYWYPRAIPEYCYNEKEMIPKPDIFQQPIPMPIPVPLPPPMKLPQPVPFPQLVPSFMPAIYPLPFGIPLAPTNPMLPIAGFPYPPSPEYMPKPTPPLMPPPPPKPLLPSPFATYVPPYGIQRRGLSMVPGLPGLVSPNGGINILPFSDAYADLLEKHKQKMIRKRLQKLLDEYDKYPWNSSHESSRRRNTRRMNNNNIDEEDEVRRPKDNNLNDPEQRTSEARKMEDIFQKYDFLKDANQFN